jgi:hypothetical protein
MGYNKAQDVLIKAFKGSVIIDKKALYLFFFKENTTHSDIKGHMPFNRQFGFIYAANQSITDLTRTMAHELGHGAFRLKHTFSNENEFVQDQGQTLNLMDYASGSELLKYQWDECHDFDLGCNWFEDGDEGASKSKSNIKITTTTTTNLLDGSKLKLGGKLLVMNDPSTQFTLSLDIDSKYIAKGAVKVDWTFEDPNAPNATPDEAYSDGTIKLGKSGDLSAKFWEGIKGYTFATTLNTTANTSIVNAKTSINFDPAGVGGDDYYIVAKIMDKDGKILKEEKSDLLTVVRKLKIDQLYHMYGADDLTSYASVANIQPFFTPAFIVYETATFSTELVERYSPEYIGLYNKNQPAFYDKWSNIAQLQGDENPQTSTKNLTLEQRADIWKNRLEDCRIKSNTNWISDAHILANSLVSIKYYHIMYGYGIDPDFSFNPYAPNTVLLKIGNFTTYIGQSYWGGPAGGVTLDQGFCVITKSTIREARIQSITHELAHLTIKMANGVQIIYRDNFGNGDHSDRSDPRNLMAPAPKGTFTSFSDKEILILRGYKNK